MNKKIRKVRRNYIEDIAGRGMFMAYPKRLCEIW
jgi:hypothetical protein